MSRLVDPDTLMVKGTLIKSALAFIADQPGSDPMARLKARLDPETVDLISGLVLPSATYPLRRFVNILEAADAAIGHGDLRFCRELGRSSADFQVNLIHKVFLKVGKLDYWMRLAGSTWKSYYGTGAMTAGFDDTSGWIHLADYNPISKAFCARFEGWGQRICELSGRKNVQPRHTSCLLDGADKCVWEVTWRD